MQKQARRASAEVVFWKKGNPTAQGVHITHECLCTDHEEESTGDRLRRALLLGGMQAATWQKCSAEVS